MQKPLIFISHIADEREVAMALKQSVNEAFIGLIDVFVSSDPNSLAMGQRWLDEITHGLKNCSIEIVLASPASIRRPWINFEAGAGWVRDIPVIPICHSGMTPDTLPPPLKSLQSGLATDAEQMGNLFAVLAKMLGANRPAVDLSSFVDAVKTFEQTSKQLAIADRSALIGDRNGLSDHAIATLVAAAECSNGPNTSTWTSNVRERMEEAGYRDIATSLGIATLLRFGIIATHDEPTHFSETVQVIEVLQGGWEWLEEHIDIIETMKSVPPSSEDIPF